MKKLLCISLILLAFVFSFTACGDDDPAEPTVTVSNDGYVLVNGVKTEYKVDTKDEISVNADGFVVVNGVTTEIVADKDDVVTVDAGGFVVVNGVKTEHKIHTTDEISVNSDGYIVVNGITTEIVADKDDVITLDKDGFIVVNGTTTSFMMDKEYHTHKFVDGLCSICITPENITEGIIYSISSNRTCAEVVGYEGTATNIKIAETFQGLPVTSICDYAFSENQKIESVIISDTITTIGKYAFYNCSNLVSVTIGKNVESFGWYSFVDCYKLVEIINHSKIDIKSEDISEYALCVHKGVSKIVRNNDFLFLSDNGFNYLLGYYGTNTNTTIPESYNGEEYFLIDYAFANCNALTNLVIPDFIVKIPYSAFENCTNLTTVIIPDSVKNIGRSAFSGCTSLTCVNLGSGITEITKNVFSGCTNLTTIKLGKNIKVIGESNFGNVTDIYYEGTEAEWALVDYERSNISDDVIMRYNYTPEE